MTQNNVKIGYQTLSVDAQKESGFAKISSYRTAQMVRCKLLRKASRNKNSLGSNNVTHHFSETTFTILA